MTTGRANRRHRGQRDGSTARTARRSFTVDFSKRRYSRQTQAMGASKLLHVLPGAGGASVPGEPVVTRIYYMRFAGAPHDALIVKNQRQPIYFTFANRNK